MKILIPCKDSFKEVLIDDEDYQELNRHSWYVHESGYVRSYAKGWMHRYILKLSKRRRRLIVDHINGDKLDNRKSNLRRVTHVENAFNRKMTSPNKYKGVRKWENKLRPPIYSAKMDYKYKQIVLFSSPVEEEAAYAYNCGLEYFKIVHAYRNPVDGLLTDEIKANVKYNVHAKLNRLGFTEL